MKEIIRHQFPMHSKYYKNDSMDNPCFNEMVMHGRYIESGIEMVMQHLREAPAWKREAFMEGVVLQLLDR